jgi:very-short-patch-repair endonuclease
MRVLPKEHMMEDRDKSPLTRRFPAPSEGATGRARELRRNSTEAERLLWQHLRALRPAGYAFRRQHPLGPYVVDFFCFECKLAIEVDGGQHSEQKRRETERTVWLESYGIRVLRFWNNQVLEDIEAVMQAILLALRPPLQTGYELPQGEKRVLGRAPHSTSLPQGERTYFPDQFGT